MQQKKEDLKKIRKVGVMKVLKMYNNLCKSCKLKSIKAVRKGGDAPKVVFKKYCDKCKTMLEERFEK